MKWKCVQFAIFHSNFETILDSAVKVDTKLSKFPINDINRNQNLWCCSYLALVAALASEADYVFIPEDPVATDWKDHLCKKLLQVVIKKKISKILNWWCGKITLIDRMALAIACFLVTGSIWMRREDDRLKASIY